MSAFISQFDLIAFDADDTLWNNEDLYTHAQYQLKSMLDSFAPPDQTGSLLYVLESRNIPLYGYGIKGFTLSMIETAVQISNGVIPSTEILKIIQVAREMMTAPVQMLPHAADVIRQLSEHCPLMIITKGDIFDQERKIERSGLQSHFKHIEIVSQKTPESYAALLEHYQIAPCRFLMVGNTLRSDILPVVDIGGWGVYIPQANNWSHEHASPTEKQKQSFVELEHLGQLPLLLENWPLNHP